MVEAASGTRPTASLGKAAAPTSFERPSTGPFSATLYRDVLTQVAEHNAVFTLTVSNGSDERIFFFTRGAILFLAVGPAGGEVLARKVVSKGLIPQDKIDELVKKANSDVPLLQDLLQDGILPTEMVKSLVEDVLEDHLVEVAFWDGLYDLNPGNPPPRIYDKDVPSVRLSVGLKQLLSRVRPKVADAPAVMATLGGSLKNTVRKGMGKARPGPEEDAVLARLTEKARPAREVLDECAREGHPLVVAAPALASLVRSQAAIVEKAKVDDARAEDQSLAKAIEEGFEKFVNRLLARTHLAAIYERVQEPEKAADQHRGIADEHLARDNVTDGVAALKEVLRFRPQDLEAREFLVKVLQQANRAGDAAREAIELGRLLITVGLPGRARHAFELALKLVPGSMSVLWMLGGLLSKLGYTEDAVKVFEEISERSKAAGDEPGAIAALQQILTIDPSNSKALAQLRKYAGYGRALVARYATAITSVVILLAVVAVGGYETLALHDYKLMRDDVVWPAVDGRKYDVALEAIENHRRKWDWSWTARLADRLRDRVQAEESAWHEQGYGQDVRAAQKLEQANQVPQALEKWRHARDTQDLDRKKLVEAAISKDEDRLKAATDGLAEAQRLLQEKKDPERAHEILARVLADAPWLVGRADVKIPMRVDSLPRGARIFVDGVPNLDPTPTIISHKAAAGTIVFEARGREPWKTAIDPVPSWLTLALLPRRPAWRASIVASSEPLIAGSLVVVAGLDRRVTAVARETGEVRWSRSLGLFGETELPLALAGKDAVVARTASGEVVALELATGVERWRRAMAPPPVDPADPWAARPIGCALGAIVREGPRAVTLLGARDGRPLWTGQARGDIAGAPAVSGELAAVAFERSMEAWKLADGAAAWIVRLPRAAASGPVAAPGNAFALATEPDDVVRLDHAGAIVSDERQVTGERASAPLWGDARGVVVGTVKGEVVFLDPTGKVAWRATTEIDRPVRWVRSVDAGLVLAGDDGVLYAFDEKGGELWRHPTGDTSAPAAGDEARVFLGDARGLSALER